MKLLRYVQLFYLNNPGLNITQSLLLKGLRDSFYSLAVFLIVCSTNACTDHKSSQNSILMADSDELISLIQSRHFLAPDEKSVADSLGGPDTLNRFLKRLDPYSRYLSEEQAEFFKKRNSKERNGIGLNLLFKGQHVLGVPLKNGPFYQKGYREAVFIHSINNQIIDFEDYSSYSFLGKLQVGSKIETVLANQDGSPSARVTVVSGLVQNPAVIEYRYKDALIVQINKFNNGDIKRIKSFLKTAKPNSKIIFDLRFSPGGDVYAMTDLLSLLLQEDVRVASIEDHNGAGVDLRTLNGQIIKKQPIYLIVSEFTASSAEIFASALRNIYSSAYILGMPTKGKCIAQELIKLNSGAVLNLSTHKVTDSNGNYCEGKPIFPDKIIRRIATLSIDNIYSVISLSEHDN